MSSRRAMVAVVLAGCALLLVHAAYRLRHPIAVDDAYMVLRYAKQMLAGHGHAWNPDGRQVFGVTGTLHLLLVTVLAGLLPLGDSSVLALASLGFTVLALGALAFVSVGLVRSPRLREKPWLAVAGMWLFVLPQRLFISQALNGMDCMSALFANTLVAGAALWLGRSGEPRALAAAVGAAFLALVARPDDGIYAILTPLLAVLLGEAPQRGRLLLRLSAGLALALALYLGIAAAVFGNPLPLPFYAKSFGYFTEYTAARAWNPFDYLGLIASAWMPVAIVVLFGITRRSAPELVALGAPVALTFGYYFTVIQIMGMGARYYMPATPFAALAALIVVDDLLAAPDGAAEVLRALRRRWPLALLLAIGVPTALRDAEAAYAPPFTAQNPGFPGACYERSAQGRLPPVNYDRVISDLSHLLKSLPSGARVALSEHGRIGAAAPQVSLDDLIALHDPEFAHRGFDPELELARKPDAIWLPHYFFVPLWHGLAADPRLWDEYEVWPDALLYGFAIRRDSPYRAQLRAGFAQIFRELYPGEDLEAWRATRLRSERPECRRDSRVPAVAEPQNDGS